MSLHHHLRTVLACLLVTSCASPPPTAPVSATLDQTPSAQTNPPPAPWTGPVPARLLGDGVRDYTYERFGGGHLTQVREAAHVDEATGARKVQAIGGADAFWPAGGVALSTIDPALVGHHAINGPAWAYRSPVPKLAGRIWFLTTNGTTSYLVGVKKDQKPNPTAAEKAALPADQHPLVYPVGGKVTRGYVVLSDDGLRAYVVTDNGLFVMMNLATGATQTANMGATAEGVSPFIDPLLTDSQRPGGFDVIFAASADGRIHRFTWNGTALVPDGAKPGTPGLTTALDGTTRLLSAPPVAIGGQVYYGDRGGYYRRMNYASGAVTTVDLSIGAPIELAVALDLDAALVPAHAFLAAGNQVAWVNVGSNAVSLSRPLLLDRSSGTGFGAGPTATTNATPEGQLSTYTYQGTAIAANKYPTDSGTAFVANNPPDAALLLPDSPTDLRFIESKISGANIINRLVANCTPTYFRGSAGWDNNGTAVAPPGTGAGRIDTSLGMTIGPQGEVILCGNDLRVVPAVTMTAYGRANMQPGRMYTLLEGKTNGGTNADARSVAYDDNRTPGNLNDDYLVYTRLDNGTVQRMRRDNGVIENIMVDSNNNTGNSAVPPNTLLTGATVAINTGNDRLAGICITTDGHIYVGARDMGGNSGTVENDFIIRLRRVGANWEYKRMYGAVGDNLYVDDLCYDSFSNRVYTADVFAHTIQAFTPAPESNAGIVNPMSIFCGVRGSNTPIPPDGTLRNAAAARLAQPSSITADPTTGDLYIGEYGGSRLKVINGPNHPTNPNEIFTIAGSGNSPGSINSCNGPIDNTRTLGSIGGLRIGPVTLADPGTDPYGILHFISRGAYYQGRIRYGFTPMAGTAKGLMKFTGLPTAGTPINWQLNVTTNADYDAVPRPDVVTAGNTYAGTLTAWTDGGLLNANNRPPNHDAAKSAYCVQGGPTQALNWTANQTLNYKLASSILDLPGNNGTLSLAVVPPTNSGFDYYFNGGLTPPSTATARATVDFYSHTATAARRPVLTGFTSKMGNPYPIAAPPVVWGAPGQNFVLVGNCNAMFRLNYTSAATFGGASDATVYATTYQGRNSVNGPVNTLLTPNAFLTNRTVPLMLYGGTMLMLDFKPTGAVTNISLNRFAALNPVNSMFQERADVNVAGLITPLLVNLETPNYITTDSWGNPSGNAYFGLCNGRIYRLKF
jgi:hypothetical protein